VLDCGATVCRWEVWLFDLWRCCHQLIICVLHQKISFFRGLGVQEVKKQEQQDFGG
jgi:hypothetical protein